MNSERSRPRSEPSEFREPEINREMLPGVMEGKSISPKKEKRPRKKVLSWEDIMVAAKASDPEKRDLLLREAKRRAELARGKEQNLDKLTNIAIAIRDIDEQLMPAPTPAAPSAMPESATPGENKITLTELTALENDRFISRVREMYRAHVATTEDKKELSGADAVVDWILNKKITRTSLTEAVDIFLHKNGDPRVIEGLNDPETGELKANGYTVKEIVEGEINARCNLRLAQLREEALKGGEFGTVTTEYVEDLSKGKFAEAQLSNKTLIWLGGILPQIENKITVSEQRPLDRKSIDTAFQQIHKVAQLVEQFRPRYAGEESKWKYFETDDDSVTDEKGKMLTQKKIKKATTNQNYMLSNAGETAIREAMKVAGVDEKCFDLIKGSVESKLSIFSGKGNDIFVEKLRGILEDNHGTDAATLAWQMFEGLRCEAQYFSGHYLGVLYLLNESRNFLSTGQYDSWKGSKHGKIAVRRGGKWLNSEGEELNDEERKQLDLNKMYGSGVEDGDVLYFGNAFMAEGELERVATTPLTQNIKVSETGVGGKIPGTEKGAVLMAWAEAGKFLEYFREARKVIGDVSIEASNGGIVRSGYALRDAITALGGVYDQQDKASQIPEVIKTLTNVKKNALLQTDKLIFTTLSDRDIIEVRERLIKKWKEESGVLKDGDVEKNKLVEDIKKWTGLDIETLRVEVKKMIKEIDSVDVDDLMKAEIEDAYWELGINNIFNTRGSQKVDKPLFLTPSGYNAFFERLVSIPSSGKALIKQAAVKTYRELTEKYRALSLQQLTELAITPDEKKIVTKESKEVYEMTLPEKLGERKVTKIEEAIQVGRNVGKPVGNVVGNVVFSLFPRKKKK